MARTWAAIEALEPTEAERELIEACRKGMRCRLGNGERPQKTDPVCTIRAEILRYLILGGSEDCRVHERGVRLAGAWIEGQLDLSFSTATGLISLHKCKLLAGLDISYASLAVVVLGSRPIDFMWLA